MKRLILLLCIAVSLTAHAQREKAEAYINTYKELAIREMIRTGVPASIKLAQGILESQYGESNLVKTSNNHFGIKCKTEWTGAKTYHDDDEKGECFRVYGTSEDSYRDHSDFLKSRPHYAFLFKLDPTDYEGWAKGLKKAGYATSPTYPQSLLKVINDYNLQQYSLDAIARIKQGITPADTELTVIAAAPLPGPSDVQATVHPPLVKPAETTVAQKEKEEEHKEAETVTPVVSAPVAAVKKTSLYPQGIFTINHTKVIYANEGISLLALATTYDISLAKLLEFNDLAEMDVLDTDRLIFLEKKQKKGASDFHVVADNETLHDICQKEGIRMESLLEYNKLNKTAVPANGQKLYLRAAIPAAARSRT
ncbi:glucosaminidase domain-containing protein [Sediminibacterium ginsengisoli]|uniref:Peptidoglycan hydrolase n=1 Tax=Sediminibacterium ginsengisoli TaxID=413434 RepID=A0A1T4KQM6_9BACT|nr:glucosaminidase domain-containing protein [Sediminibacterium ginsengisoli]SJZ44714.1 Flagellum-specific peptidoglycan hydrolase FlgJ [Sediminibacterium ginsengisoli]